LLSTIKYDLLVSVSKQSRKFRVPDELANLYDFVNSLDLRCFTHNRVQHVPGDELRSPLDLGAWMSERGLLQAGATVTPSMLETAIELRSNLRAYLECDTDERNKNRRILRSLNQSTSLFPLVVEAGGGTMQLEPVRSDALAGLSNIVAELHRGAANGTLSRLKMCAAEECRRVFFDRSKPASRRWCVSTLCGNRMKTRTYRERHQGVP
jgi:predicted RNA-binding Zn ribbon-like protein